MKKIALCIISSFCSIGILVASPSIDYYEGKNFNNVTIEMSLKPFKENSPEYIHHACHVAFKQWESLLAHADTVSVLLWTSDGSEILEYSGDVSQKLEWGKYAGNPNAANEINSGPKELTLHQRAYTYIENPPSFTYNDLKNIIKTIKIVGREVTGKVIKVGETFDPGPEFAISKFKYELHPEICMANTLGAKSFVCCYASLKSDTLSYAAYPKGIPDGTLFGTFFGKQSQIFLKDMGFDYLWLSNGFGFGMEPWSTIGAIFNGKGFNNEKIDEIHNKIIDFWDAFRKECPNIPIETRGTNLSTGIDLARDGVDLKSIYNGGYNILPPPNSPWAALDGDFGLELVGYMSHIAEIPDNRYLFRYYIHDPWWVNSPWLDRYGRQAHDIYLPMAVSRIDSDGIIKLPTNLNFLSIDNTYGDMLEQVPEEVIPHILQGRRFSPDKAGPLVWLYPFDEYHDWAFNKSENLPEVFFGDWFMRQALNEGFPINTVTSTTTFSKLMSISDDSSLVGSILVSVVPDDGSLLEKYLMNFVERGGRLIVYGPVQRASKKFLDFLSIEKTEPLSGVFTLKLNVPFDSNGFPMLLKHDDLLSAGGIETKINSRNNYSRSLAQVIKKGQKRDVVIYTNNPEWNGGSVCYVRATNSTTYKGGHLLTPDDRNTYFLGGALMRFALIPFGYSIKYDKPLSDIASPVNVISRNRNGFVFSGYVPNQTVRQNFLFPQGAPVFIGYETLLVNNSATYYLPRSWNRECRIFVRQKDGMVSCWEIPPVEFGIKRKIGISGLKDATLIVYPEVDTANYYFCPGRNEYPDRSKIIKSELQNDYTGYYYEYNNLNGSFVMAW